MAEEKTWDKFNINEWKKQLAEKAPKIKKDYYVEKTRALHNELLKCETQMQNADSSRYSHLKKDFNKALKAIASLTNALNRKGATIPY